MYTNIIVGYDGSPQADDALALGQLIAAATGAALMPAGVVVSDPRWGGKDLPESPAESAGADVKLVASTSAARGLHILAEDTGADLVVVGSTSHGKAGRILAGSLATRLLHGSPCSVAIAPHGFADKAPDAIAEVLVGYDGSPEAREALDEALELARGANAPVRLVAVAQPAPIVHGRAAAPSPGQVADEAAHRHMRECLDEALEAAPGDVQVEATLVDGDPAESLAKLTDGDGRVLIVGSRGYGPLRRVLLGSVSTELVRSAACAVIVHPRPAKEPERASQSPAARASVG